MTREIKIKCAYNSIKSRIPFCPKVAIVIDSDIEDVSDICNIQCVIPYSEIRGFPNSKAHGEFIFGYVKETPVVIMHGRIHYYENNQMSDVVFPIYLMKLMGTKILLITNVARAVNNSFVTDDIMLITDHISKFVPSCLTGENGTSFEQYFSNLNNLYCAELNTIVRNSAGFLEIELKEGIYIQFAGPEYETNAEINMSYILGADAVGINTACEAVASNYSGMYTCGISRILNFHDCMDNRSLSNKKGLVRFKKLIIESVSNMNNVNHK
ncbi:MAG: purine-nucleoside phosphorylase [Oscillospiraceae bacterium]|nr:purine-nucleoside phosphorylase [Oscillospiraceae bacterium]